MDCVEHIGDGVSERLELALLFDTVPPDRRADKPMERRSAWHSRGEWWVHHGEGKPPECVQRRSDPVRAADPATELPELPVELGFKVRGNLTRETPRLRSCPDLSERSADDIDITAIVTAGFGHGVNRIV